MRFPTPLLALLGVAHIRRRRPLLQDKQGTTGGRSAENTLSLYAKAPPSLIERPCGVWPESERKHRIDACEGEQALCLCYMPAASNSRFIRAPHNTGVLRRLRVYTTLMLDCKRLLYTSNECALAATAAQYSDFMAPRYLYDIVEGSRRACCNSLIARR